MRPSFLFPSAFLSLTGWLAISSPAQAQAPPVSGGNEISSKPARAGDLDALTKTGPTFSHVSYGSDVRHVLDFWKPKSDTPTPVVMFIHGGGFAGGDKSGMTKQKDMNLLVQSLLAQGIACASINYRFTQTTPLHQIMRDGARAVQFIRSKSTEWNVDKTRFGAIGVSAGAGMSLWLATRDDLADANNPDPVLKESSRVGPTMLIATQATYNFPKWDIFLGPPQFEARPNEAAQMYRLKSNEAFKTPAGKALLRECDMLEWISEDEGPFMIFLGNEPGTTTTWDGYVHHPQHAREIKKACDEAGADCELVKQVDQNTFTFLVRNLKTP